MLGMTAEVWRVFQLVGCQHGGDATLAMFPIRWCRGSREDGVGQCFELRPELRFVAQLFAPRRQHRLQFV